jgi:ketosteroid isomerase-like protein
MHLNEELIRRFYTAFQARDAEAMGACYAPDVVFEDPAFGELKGDEARAMWAMLCGRATDLTVVCDHAEADDAQGAGRWHADYTFTQTGRKVNNRIAARFRFRDGLISEHRDHFSMLRAKVRSTARRGLKAYRTRAAESR